VAQDLADDGTPLKWQDKVKMVRTRTRINGLQAAVKEKEHIVARRRFVSKTILQLYSTLLKLSSLCFYI